MIAALRQLQGHYAFEIRVVDVDSDAELEMRYGERVPVLEVAGRELCHYFMDALAVTDFLAKTR